MNSRKSSLQQLLQLLLTSHSISTLLSLDFPDTLLQDVDTVLLSLARKYLGSQTASVPGVPQYYAILYAWRIKQDNYRGAAQILYERLHYLKSDRELSDHFDPEDQTLIEAYLMLINTLACCGEEEGWILAERIDALESRDQPKMSTFGKKSGSTTGDDTRTSKKVPKRKIVTLEDVRREYQAELDRRSEIFQGRFALVGDEMDVL